MCIRDRKSYQRIERALSLEGKNGFDTNKYLDDFEESMNDDLGTPSAVATIFDLVHEINVRNSKSQGIAEGVNLLKNLLNILGFDTENNKLEDKDIIDLLEKRNNFRIEKKYDQADEIRDQLLDLGIEILDSKDGSTYRKI